MSEDLTPGIYVEETSARPGRVEGVPTSTLGMAGTTEYGPVPHPSNDGKRVRGPVLVTSMTEYERVYGALTNRGAPCRLALAARAFFENGGQRLFVQRVFVPTAAGAGTGPEDDIARVDLPLGATNPVVTWRARWPGAAGSRVRVVTRFRRSDNVMVGTQLVGLVPGAAVEIARLVAGQPPVLADEQAPAHLRVVTQVDGMLRLRDNAGEVTAPVPDHAAFHVTLDVEVHFGDRVDVYRGLELGPEHPQYIKTVLHDTEPPDENGLVWLDDAEPGAAGSVDTSPTAASVLAALVSPGGQGVQLVGGSDGDELSPNALEGQVRGAARVSSVHRARGPDRHRRDRPRRHARHHLLPGRGKSQRGGGRPARALRTGSLPVRARGPAQEPRRRRCTGVPLEVRQRVRRPVLPWLRISDPTPGPDPVLRPPPLTCRPQARWRGSFPARTPSAASTRHPPTRS